LLLIGSYYCNAFSTIDTVQFANLIEPVLDSEQSAKRLREKANYHLRIGELEQSIDFLDQSLSMTKDPDLSLDLLLTKSGVFFGQFEMEKALSAVRHGSSFINDQTSFDKKSSIVFLEGTILHFIDRLSEAKMTFSEAISPDNSIKAHSYNDRIIENANNNQLWHFGDIQTGLNFFKDHINKGQVLHLAESSYFRYLGDIYLIRKNFDEALYYYNKISTEDSDLASISFTYYTRLIEANMLKGDLEATRAYLDELSNANDGNPFKQSYLDFLTLSYQIYADELEDSEAPLNLIKQTEDSGLKFFTHLYTLKFAEAYFSQGQLKKAQDLINQIPYSIGDQITDYNRKLLLKEMAQKIGHSAQIQKLDSEINGMKSVIEVFNLPDDQIDKMVGQVYPLNQKKPISASLLALLISIPFIFLGIYFSQRKKQSRLKAEKEELYSNYQNVLDEKGDLEKNIEISIPKEDHEAELEKQLAEKQAEISQIEGSIEKQMHEKLAKLSKYQEKLAGLKEELTLMEKRTTGSLNLEIQQLLSRIGTDEGGEDFLELYANQFEQKNPEFVLKLAKDFKLTEKQKVICYSIKNGISIHDTAQLLGTTKFAIKKARNRIWKQLNFESYDAFKQYITVL